MDKRGSDGVSHKDMVSISREDLKELKRLYKECKSETFMFKGREFLKGYAKYMIEYLDNRFGEKND